MNQYHKRLNTLQKLLKESSCDACLIDDLIDLFYLTGLNMSAGRLFVSLNDAILVVDGRYYEFCKANSPCPVLLAENNQTLKQILSLPENRSIQTLAINGSHIKYQGYIELSKEVEKINAEGQRQNPISLKIENDLVAKMRIIKSLEEIQTLKAAAVLGSEGFDYACSLLKEGITEEEIAIELEIFWKRRGGKKLAFDPIIAFGINSSMPHYRSGEVKLKKDEHVLIDIGVTFQHYHSDMTRIVYFGTPNPKIIEIHKIVQEAQLAALKLCKPGTLIGDLDAAARDKISSYGYGDYFTHSLGHGVGLEIHESPILRNKPPYKDMPLMSGMVITIEPGIYLPGIGGVRLEDTVVITDQGHENLTNRPLDITLPHY